MLLELSYHNAGLHQIVGWRGEKQGLVHVDAFPWVRVGELSDEGED